MRQIKINFMPANHFLILRAICIADQYGALRYGSLAIRIHSDPLRSIANVWLQHSVLDGLDLFFIVHCSGPGCDRLSTQNEKNN